MQPTKNVTREEIENILSEMENEDETLPLLEKAANYFCGTWDLCEGYKHALLETLQDQYDNHPEEQDPNDLNKLSNILQNKTK